MFKRSVEKHDVKIGNYVGDGDSKTYGNPIKAKPYGDDLIVAKKECVGHVQKKMGTRLRDLVKSHVGEVPIKTANIAAVTFNEGSGALLSCMHDLGIGLGPSAHAYVKEVDAERIGRAEFNATTQTKEARIQERLDKKMKEDQYIAEGTVLYGAGIDDSV
ncbi:unnamed protein product [Hermetia illucens]|uniref:Mutator-like transposase domain-containing protein n=1 Tax=Hermetia illucens TaxID=343691 RepID=A0A7R8UDB7_HERIL|nr:unnamed protein product [Hermetia illucens]